MSSSNHLCDLIPGTTERDRSLVIAPLSHGAGMHFLLQLATGAASVLMPPGRLDPAIAWQLVDRHRITNMFTVPTIVKMLVEDPAVDLYDHGSLRYVIYAGAPMYRADQKVALHKLGKVLVQYFGLGEVTGCITVLPAEEHQAEDIPGARIGTCGRERTGMQVTIRDDAGRNLPPMTTGEICVTGPGVCAGYYRNDEANAQAFRDGWFCTGDLGHMDAEGYLYITGRKSDMFISGGSNVYPREIEELLLTHPDIAEAAIIGVPDALWGEVGMAVCAVLPGSYRMRPPCAPFSNRASPGTSSPLITSFCRSCPRPDMARSPIGSCARRSRQPASFPGRLDESKSRSRPTNRRDPPSRSPAAAPPRDASGAGSPDGAGFAGGTGAVVGSGHAGRCRRPGRRRRSAEWSRPRSVRFRPSQPADQGQAQAAWYSATHAERAGVIDHGTAILGRRDGEWFLHCHAAWEGADGKRHLGHLLPATIAAAGPGRVGVLGFTGARYDAAPCPETGFTLFAPQVTRLPDEANGTLLRLRPFEDLTTALAEVAAPYPEARAWGIGSLIGTTFDNGNAMEDAISEVALLPGCDPTAPLIEAVDTAGRLFQGRPVRGATPILITAEVLVIGSNPARIAQGTSE